MATSSGSAGMSELDLLKSEIDELKVQLKVADEAKNEAATLGLQLLKERTELEQQIDELHKECETNRAELSRTRKVFINSLLNIV